MNTTTDKKLKEYYDGLWQKRQDLVLELSGMVFNLEEAYNAEDLVAQDAFIKDCISINNELFDLDVEMLEQDDLNTLEPDDYLIDAGEIV